MDKQRKYHQPGGGRSAETSEQRGADPCGRFDEAAQMLKSPLQQSRTWRAVDAAAVRSTSISCRGTSLARRVPGKTTALANSGLSRWRTASVKPRCWHWRRATVMVVYPRAVLLDTAGRYTTQESEQVQDAGEWLEFINLLRKYRRRQPINGVIITISISDLLSQSAEASRQQAVNLRQRLSELHEQLGIRFPVYVMVTKADLLKGFRAWFADYDKAQRDQIWGFTLPWEQTKHADYDLMGNFQQEFSLLQQRLDAGLPETMLKEHDAKTRAEAYLFPQEFAALRPLLADYLSTVFARSNFETEFSPRGIYFASGTQEGMPFDRVMGELNRALSLPEGGESTRWDSVSKEAPIPGAKGQSFFIKNLLQNVIFQEAGIAGENRWWELRNRAVMWSGYAALLALLVILGGLWLTSYAKNKAYLEEVDAKVPMLEQRAGRETNSAIWRFCRCNNLVDLPKSDAFDVNNPRFPAAWALSRG
ncbi:MAG: type VI secretion system membrane subunit TssM [Enterobacter hormaechei]